jgi:hypothetical protein
MVVKSRLMLTPPAPVTRTAELPAIECGDGDLGGGSEGFTGDAEGDPCPREGLALVMDVEAAVEAPVEALGTATVSVLEHPVVTTTSRTNANERARLKSPAPEVTMGCS